MKANGFEEKTARGAFDMMDKNKNSIIDCKEFIAAEMKSWLDLDNKDTDGIYNNNYLFLNLLLSVIIFICRNLLSCDSVQL